MWKLEKSSAIKTGPCLFLAFGFMYEEHTEKNTRYPAF